MRPTLKEIAKTAGVSVPTVSLVLNEKGQISEETRALVKRVISEMGYKRKPSCRVVGVLGKPTKELLGDLTQAAAEYGYDLERLKDLEMIDLGTDAASPESRSNAVAGVIVYGGQWNPATLDQISNVYPTVLLGGHARRPNVDSIWVDSSDAIDLAVEYLVSKGHRAIALLNGPLDTPTSWEKRAGFERAISISHTPVRGVVVNCSSFAPADARQAALSLLSSAPDVTAVVLAERLMAVPVCALLVEQQRSVPDDLSLIIFRDDPSLFTTSPPMTAIGFSSLEIARDTLAYLVRRINDPLARGRRVLFRPYIIERGSVAEIVG